MPDPKYGWAHQKQRRAWLHRIKTGQVPCVLCGYPIAPDGKWHLDHLPGGGPLDYRGPAHAHCNTSDGGKRGARSRPRSLKRWVL